MRPLVRQMSPGGTIRILKKRGTKAPDVVSLTISGPFMLLRIV